RLVVVVTDVSSSDFIGGDVVPQRDPGTPREVLALELTPHQVGIHREEQHPSSEPYAVGPLLDAPGAQPLQHARKMTPCRRWIKRIFFRPPSRGSHPMRSVTLVAAAAAACATTAPLMRPALAPTPAPYTFAASTAAMDAHLKYLADDELEGRAPATRGGRLAVKYIAAQFEAMGLEPGAADGSYFQPVALVGMTPRPSLVWGRGGAPRRPGGPAGALDGERHLRLGRRARLVVGGTVQARSSGRTEHRVRRMGDAGRRSGRAGTGRTELGLADAGRRPARLPTGADRVACRARPYQYRASRAVGERRREATRERFHAESRGGGLYGALVPQGEW